MELNLQMIEGASLAEKRDATKDYPDSRSHRKDRVFEKLKRLRSRQLTLQQLSGHKPLSIRNSGLLRHFSVSLGIAITIDR